MLDDQQLLRRYVTDGSEAAFGELVARYVNLVYSTALRRADGNAHLAQDVAQLVFTDLARKARSLPKGVVLPGWLHRASRYATAQLLRTEHRRRVREQEAVAMNTLNSEAAPDWERIHPMLDEALDELGRTDRDALVLRFFDQRSLAEVGHALGSNEEAARKRVARALEKLRASLVRRGVTTTAAALSTVLAMNAVQGAPAGLAATLASASLASAAAGTGTALGIMEVMTMTKLQLGIIAAVVVGSVATPLVIQHQAAVRLRAENQSLRQQVNRLAQLTAENERLSHLLARSRSSPTPRLPAPPMQVTTPPAPSPTEDLHSTNLIARLLKDGHAPKLTRDKVEPYLKENQRSAGSLVAAFRVTGDMAFLKEAEEKFPNDPRVAFAAAFNSDSPEERRQWLDAFKQSAPDNALANYLSALDYFKAGQTDQAVQELIAASDKPQCQDYSLEYIQDDEEAYLAAGHSVAEAKALAAEELQRPQLGQVKQLGHDIVDLATSYRQAGDEASAQAALQMATNVGHRYEDASHKDYVINDSLGVAVEFYALEVMDPNSSYGDNGQTVQDRINQLWQLQDARRELWHQAEPLLQMMSDQDWIIYRDRQMIFGEKAALQWLVSKYGQK